MRLKVTILLPLSIVLGLAAVQSGRSWLDRQMDERARVLDTRNQAKPQSFSTIVVASEPLRFGNEITPGLLKEIPWAGTDVPKGAFSRVADVFSGGARRLSLGAIESNEPILETKITGPGQKANLAAIIEDGKKAITVRVDDVVGVAGFILPGDRVDILLTRKSGESRAVSDNILQYIKVLAIDQKADDRLDKPSIARAVTLEVSTQQAQHLNVAQSVGTLSLILRPVGEEKLEPSQRVSSGQLSGGQSSGGEEQGRRHERPVSGNTSVNVVRNIKREEYSVPVDRGQ